MSEPLVVLLHLCDSLFPIGSFAHSDGLEDATSRQRVATSADLRQWMDVALTETLRSVEAPAVSRAWRCADLAPSDWREVVAALDDEVHALRPSSAAREASRAMGARLLKTWQQLRPDSSLADLLSTRARWTLPVAFGTVAASSGISESSAVEGFMYTRMAATISAAMRLMPVGQQEGHLVLADGLARVPALAAAAIGDRSPLTMFAPALDIAAMNQQYGHSRLFRS